MNPDPGRSHAADTSQKEWTVLAMLEWATRYFEEKGVSNPRISIEWLLSDLLRLKRLDLYLKYDRPLSVAELEQLRDWVRRRARNEPLQYITGSTDFFGCTIRVGSGVLVPRPETEQLVELILEHHDAQPLQIADFGTGSGCIAVALKKNRPRWEVFAVDVSTEALEMAEKNASLNETDISFLKGDMRTPGHIAGLPAPDIIVSNPPYILPHEAADLDAEVVQYEPALALFDPDPVTFYRTLAHFGRNNGKTKAAYFEMHADYAAQIEKELCAEGFATELHRDYGGKDRMLVVRYV